MHIKERLLNKKESEALTDRNLCSTSDVVIEENNLPDVQIIQKKEKQDRETILKVQEIQNESSTATAIDTIMAVESLDKIVINNNSTTSIPTTISKFDAEKTKIFTPEKEKEADNVMMINIPYP